MQNYRSLFQRATLDMIILMDLDYHDSFQCPHGGKSLTADGIMLGYKMGELCITRPYEAATSGVRVPGALLPSSRLFVRQADHRKKLMRLTTAKIGLSADDLDSLQSGVAGLPSSRPESALLPFLSQTVATADGDLLAAMSWRELGASLATTAPACQLLPRRLWPVIEVLLADKRLSLDAQRDVAAYSPLLHEFLRRHLAGTCEAAVLQLLESLLKVLAVLPCSAELVSCCVQSVSRKAALVLSQLPQSAPHD